MAKEENIGKSNKGGKVVKMPQPTQQNKMESMGNLIEQLDKENKALRQRLSEAGQHIRQMNMEGFYTRLSWLWTVISADEKVRKEFNPDFVARCYAEFEDMMTPPKAPKQPEGDQKAEQPAEQ